MCRWLVTLLELKLENRTSQKGKTNLLFNERLHSCMIGKVQKETQLGLTLVRHYLFNYVVYYCLQRKHSMHLKLSTQLD